jgi:hypothetical protein
MKRVIMSTEGEHTTTRHSILRQVGSAAEQNEARSPGAWQNGHGALTCALSQTVGMRPNRPKEVYSSSAKRIWPRR